jgi:hypothetical protein
VSIGRSAVAGEPLAGSADGGGQLVKKPPPKRTLTALADRTAAPEPR